MAGYRASNVDIKLLRLFVAIVEHNGISLAANRLDVAVPVLSRALSSLETRFGVTLCRRGKAGFQLTPQGRDIYDATRQTLRELELFEMSVTDIARQLRGRLRVAVIDSLATNERNTLSSALRRMNSDMPNVFLEVSVLPPAAIESAVDTRQIDIGVTAWPIYTRSLTYTPIFQEHHRLYAASGLAARWTTPTARARRATFPYVGRRYPSQPFAVVENRTPFVTVASADSAEAAMHLVVAGVGASLMPAHYASQFRSLGVVEIPLPETPITTEIMAVHHTENTENPALRAMLSYLAGSAASAPNSVGRAPGKGARGRPPSPAAKSHKDADD